MDCRRVFYFTLRDFEGLKDTTFFALILIFSFVSGLMPVLAARCFTLNVPKPSIDTLPDFTTAFAIVSTTSSKTRFDSAREYSPCLASCF